MKKEKTTPVSFRVPNTVLEKIDKVADEIPRGSKQKVLQTVFIPAFERYYKRHLEKTAQAAA